jgi:hypothetical protein
LGRLMKLSNRELDLSLVGQVLLVDDYSS